MENCYFDRICYREQKHSKIRFQSNCGPFKQKPDKCQFQNQVCHHCKCLEKVKAFLAFTHRANLRQMRRLPPLPSMQNYHGKFDPTLSSKIEQMCHLPMVCSKFAIQVNPFFVQCYTLELVSFSSLFHHTDFFFLRNQNSILLQLFDCASSTHMLSADL